MIDNSEDARRIFTDATETSSVKDLVIKAIKQRDWSQEETATFDLRQASKIGYQIYLDEIARRHQ